MNKLSQAKHTQILAMRASIRRFARLINLRQLRKDVDQTRRLPHKAKPPEGLSAVRGIYQVRAAFLPRLSHTDLYVYANSSSR
jgi:hypothetical protein